MQIFIENGRVVIELTPNEFSAFSAMFANLGVNHCITIEGLDWPGGSAYGAKFKRKILPIHLCRTIGEAWGWNRQGRWICSRCIPSGNTASAFPKTPTLVALQ